MATENNSVLARYPSYEVVIGMEVHVQLATKTKMFCGCPTIFGSAPNTNICHICSGHPGTLPVPNKQALDYAIMAGLALGCTISEQCEFARKHYMYPDLPKNYQITQGDVALCHGGQVPIILEDGTEKIIHLERIHVEEDAGKNIHAGTGQSLVDLNRAGTPLIEIVTKPEMSSAFETKAYLMRLHAIVRYLGISQANMEEGSFRGDVNISVRKKGASKLGTKVELKNINSFKFICNAIEYEIERQIELIEDGGKISQETRLWDSKQNKTYFMRSKETAQDYRYVMDPDLPLIVVDEAWKEKLASYIPELPQQKHKRFQAEFGLSAYEATIVTDSKELASFYEQTVKLSNQPKLASNWILRDLLGYLKEHKLELAQSPITPELLAELLKEISSGSINSKIAQDVFAEMAASGKAPSKIIDDKDLRQIDSDNELESIVKQIIDDNAANVERYRSGKTNVFGFFVGQAMKATRGKANPKKLNELFKRHLEG